MEKTVGQINGERLINSFADQNSEGNYRGLTKREYFAGLAMQSLLTVGDGCNLIEDSIEYADKLLEALSK